MHKDTLCCCCCSLLSRCRFLRRLGGNSRTSSHVRIQKAGACAFSTIRKQYAHKGAKRAAHRYDARLGTDGQQHEDGDDDEQEFHVALRLDGGLIE